MITLPTLLILGLLNDSFLETPRVCEKRGFKNRPPAGICSVKRPGEILRERSGRPSEPGSPRSSWEAQWQGMKQWQWSRAGQDSGPGCSDTVEMNKRAVSVKGRESWNQSIQAAGVGNPVQVKGPRGEATREHSGPLAVESPGQRE